MKKSITVLVLGLVAFAGTAMADNSFYDKARVIKVKPIYEMVRVNQPVEQCWNESVEYPGHARRDSFTPTIAGAVVGGVVGNQFGKGRGKDAMTVVGALLGGSIGNDMGRRPHRSYVSTERRCELIDNYTEHEELVGYRVKYKYKGKIFRTRTDTDPGRFIQVRVSVAPVEG